MQHAKHLCWLSLSLALISSARPQNASSGVLTPVIPAVQPAGPPAPDPLVTLTDAQWTTLLKDLGSDVYSDRAAAQHRLAELSPENLATLRTFAKQATDAEVKARLDARIAEITAVYQKLLSEASARHRAGNLSATIALVARICQIEPDTSNFRWYGNLLQDDGDYKGAITQYTRAIELATTPSDDLYICRAVARSRMGDHKAALRDLDDAIRVRPRSALAYYNRGNVKEALTDIDGAIEDLSGAIAIDVRYADAYYNRGTLKHNKGDYAAAIADLTQAIELREDFAYAYCNRAFAKQVSGDFDGALADFDKALRLNPDQSWAYADRGTLYYAKNDLAKSLQDFREAARRAPKGVDGQLLLWLVQARLNQRAPATEALALFLKNTDDLPNDLSVSVARYMTGAITPEALLQAADQAGTDPNGAAKAYYSLGITKELNGDPAGSLPLYEKAAAIAPKNALVLQLVNTDLKRLKPRP